MSVPERPLPLLADPFAMLQRHRALVGAGVYLFVSAVGALYYSLLLGEFGLDAFDFWEASDFLLAVFREPIALVFGLMALLLWFSLNYQRAFNDWMYGRLPWLGRLVRYQRWRESRFWNESPGFFATTAFALVWFVIVMGSIASSTARNAQLGKDDQVTLQLEGGRELRGVLLTATNRYLFVVVPTPDAEAVRLQVVPYDALISVESCGARRGLLRTMIGQARDCVKVSAPAKPAAGAG